MHFLQLAIIRAGKVEDAVAVWKALANKMDSYVDFSAEVCKNGAANVVAEYGKKAYENMSNYTVDFAKSKKNLCWAS